MTPKPIRPGGGPSGEVEAFSAPVLPMLSSVVFPAMVANIQVTHPQARKLIDQAKDGDVIGLFVQKNAEIENPRATDLYRVGVSARVLNRLMLSDEIYQIFLHGIERISVESFKEWDPYIVASMRPLENEIPPQAELEPLIEQLIGCLEQFIPMAPRIPIEVLNLIKMNANDGGRLADLIATQIPFELRDRQHILEALDVEHRLNIILEMIEREIANIRVINEMTEFAKEEVTQQQRRMLLRRQLKLIQRELGEDPEHQRLAVLKKKISTTRMSEPARQQAEKEFIRLETMPSSSSEYGVITNYLDWLLELPWESPEEDNTDLQRAKDILDKYHYGLEDVKERILEFLAVRYLRKDVKGPVLCFSGPPGVGKTSLGRAIAESMGRPFARFSVGGLRDESEIHGHRRTYVGAMPGRIVQNLKLSGAANPVFMLDEIDKMGADFRGDPSAALLEVLDPEQNTAFYDHYLDIPIDLSQVFFIVTANVLANIPPALRDRLEVIGLPGYIEIEKVEIAKRHLLPRQKDANGLSDGDLSINDAALRRIILGHTREAGVRNLERQIANICRKTAKRIVAGDMGPFKVTGKNLPKLLGPERFVREAAAAEDAIGVATALAWSQVGGEILFVEAINTPGEGPLKLTGQVGQVMRESAEAALSYVKNHAKELKIDPEVFKTTEIHVHLPEGAVPKDGPSAGIAIVVAIASLLSGRSVDHTVAMTGEINLRGQVLAIGGLKDKAIAAHRAGITTVIIPKRNVPYLKEFPKEVTKDLDFKPVETIDEVLKIVLK